MHLIEQQLNEAKTREKDLVAIIETKTRQLAQQRELIAGLQAALPKEEAATPATEVGSQGAAQKREGR